jgi:hypothetical protein
MNHRLFRDEQAQDHTQIGAEKIPQIGRRAEGNEQAEQIHFQPALRDFGRRRVHAREAHAQIPFLLLEIVFEDFLEKLLVAVEQGLMYGGLGVSVLKNRMMIAAGINVAQHGNVREAAQDGGDGHQPLRDELFDDALILREAFERFHAALPNFGRLSCRPSFYNQRDITLSERQRQQ